MHNIINIGSILVAIGSSLYIGYDLGYKAGFIQGVVDEARRMRNKK